MLSPVLHPVTVFCLTLFSLPACSFIEFLTPDVVFLKIPAKGSMDPFELLYQDRFSGERVPFGVAPCQKIPADLTGTLEDTCYERNAVT